MLGVIQSEIDAGVFRRDEWRQGASRAKKTVKWYASIWLESRKKMVEKGLLVKSTVIDNTTNVKLYILPRFGRRALSSITAKDILEFKSSISRSPAGVSNVLGTFQKMLNDAAEEGWIANVPRFPSMTKKSLEPKKSLSIEVQERILDSIPFQDRAIFQFLVEYGVRPGEARGLLKSSISNGVVRIQDSFSVNQLRHTTKTGVIREFPVTSFFQKVLDAMPKSSSQFVFVRSKDGKPYTSKDLNRIWHEACSGAGVGYFKLYNGVRHSKARNLLEAGYSFDMVAEVLGHASVDMTRRFYADMPQGRIKDALESLRQRQSGQ